MSDEQTINLFDRLWEGIFKLCEKRGAIPLNKLPGCFYEKIDRSWELAVNGLKTPQKATFETEDESGSESIEPYHCHVHYNGWPAAVLHPGGGTVCAGSKANLQKLVEAVEAAVNRGHGGPGKETQAAS